jgi:hypothetical protein
MLLTGRVNFGLIQLCLRMVPSYLRDSGLLNYHTRTLNRTRPAQTPIQLRRSKVVRVLASVSCHLHRFINFYIQANDKRECDNFIYTSHVYPVLQVASNRHDEK